jgi:hypothetical protein
LIKRFHLHGVLSDKRARLQQYVDRDRESKSARVL